MHESSEKFEIRPDPTTDFVASCPLALEKYGIASCFASRHLETHTNHDYVRGLHD